MDRSRSVAQGTTPARTVWVVEDDEPIARCLEMLLQDSGYGVELAGSLAAARTLTGHPDLVILDYLLPDGNGVAFLPELAARHHAIPVILLTALDRVGASSFPNHVKYLPKPFRNKQLLDLIAAQFHDQTV